jgi:hypothetical protein
VRIKNSLAPYYPHQFIAQTPETFAFATQVRPLSPPSWPTDAQRLA